MISYQDDPTLALAVQLISEIRQSPHPSYISTASPISTLEKAKIELQRRNLFGAALPEELRRQCAWPMLLDLFVCEEEERKVSITSLCYGSGKPATTALRWINLLEQHELIYRATNSQDKRSSFVRLTAAGHRKVEHTLCEIVESERRAANARCVSPKG